MNDCEEVCEEAQLLVEAVGENFEEYMGVYSKRGCGGVKKAQKSVTYFLIAANFRYV